MTDTQKQLLARIHHSLESAVLPDNREFIPDVILPLRTGEPNTVERFTCECDALGVRVYPAASSIQAAEIAIDLLRQAAARSDRPQASSNILAWADSELPIPEVGPAVRAAGFIPLDTYLPDDRQLRRVRLGELGQASAGLTGAQGALADSGSLALLSGTGCPRLASLLPPIHIALLSKKSIYPTMAAFLSVYGEKAPQSSNLVFITGPSRTADIEQNLITGVHGPREVYVIIVD
jgi:L-lactate utilization protein LutC